MPQVVTSALQSQRHRISHHFRRLHQRVGGEGTQAVLCCPAPHPSPALHHADHRHSSKFSTTAFPRQHCSDFEARHQAAKARQTCWSRLRNAVFARIIGLLFCHRCSPLSTAHIGRYCLDVCARFCFLRPRLFSKLTCAQSSFAVDVCTRKYKNGQHSISQLAAGCILGTMNCGAMVLTLRSNAAIAAQLDAFLKGAWGQSHAIALFFPAINVMMLARCCNGSNLSRRSSSRRVPQRTACIYCYFIKINGAQFFFFKRRKSEVNVATHISPHFLIHFIPANYSLSHHARLCAPPVGVLGDASGLHLGDGLEPRSELVADADTWSSPTCPSALVHSKHAPAISRKPARG